MVQLFVGLYFFMLMIVLDMTLNCLLAYIRSNRTLNVERQCVNISHTVIHCAACGTWALSLPVHARTIEPIHLKQLIKTRKAILFILVLGSDICIVESSF